MRKSKRFTSLAAIAALGMTRRCMRQRRQFEQ